MADRGAADLVYASRQKMTFEPARIFLIGLSGSGKTVVGKRLAEVRGRRLYDTDSRVLEMEKSTSISRIFEEKGEAYFRSQELACLDEIAAIDEPLVVATGGGLPAIPGAMDRILSMGIAVYLRAGVEELWRRLTGDLADRPLLQEGGPKTLDKQLEVREPIFDRATIILDTGSFTVTQVVALLQAQFE